MKPTMMMFVCVLAAGLASAQNPSIIQNTRETMNGVRDNAAAASNAALGPQNSSTPQTQTTGAVASSSSAKPVNTASAKRKGTAHKSVKKASAKAANSPANSPAAKTVAGVPTAPISSAGENPAGDEQAASDTKWSGNGKRDPFVSPVVAHTGGSGCSSGKKCLEIGAINLRGIVHSESGFIAVVSNGLNKAYFLHENDPVFNGYVVKITGDSIVFQETLQDRLGKTFTREVVKKITAPAV